MSSTYDSSDFVDSEFQDARAAGSTVPAPGVAASAGEYVGRAPTLGETESRVGETQQRLLELRRAQEELERERAALEDLRRRQLEYKAGREEMLAHLTRGLGLLTETEFAARRDAEQMARTIADLRAALDKVELLDDRNWTQEDGNLELTRALTTLENARMEWNAARQKFAVLEGEMPGSASPVASKDLRSLLNEASWPQLCRFGLALTWPLVLLGLAIFLALILRK